jgi:hypothetical protein
MSDRPGSLEEFYDSYKRVYPWYRGPNKLKRLIGWVDADELRVSIIILLIASLAIAGLDLVIGIDPVDVLVEGHGFLMDLIVFGGLVLWFNQRRSKRDRIRQYRENLEDLREWGTEEGVLKKVGSINRLLDVDGPASLPYLDYQQLPGANFQGVDLQGVTLSFANLHSAFLNGTYLADADLVGADLSESCLAWAVCEHTDLRGANLRGADLEGIHLKGAKLGNVTVGEASSRGPITYVTDLRGVTGLTPEALLTAEGWEECYRDPELGCGKSIPVAPSRIVPREANKRSSKKKGYQNRRRSTKG